ncbi:hypothetical protein Vretimale_1027, partial [Volvox reticuliferus]
VDLALPPRLLAARRLAATVDAVGGGASSSATTTEVGTALSPASAAALRLPRVDTTSGISGSLAFLVARLARGLGVASATPSPPASPTSLTAAALGVLRLERLGLTVSAGESEPSTTTAVASLDAVVVVSGSITASVVFFLEARFGLASASSSAALVVSSSSTVVRRRLRLAGADVSVSGAVKSSSSATSATSAARGFRMRLDDAGPISAAGVMASSTGSSSILRVRRAFTITERMAGALKTPPCIKEGPKPRATKAVFILLPKRQASIRFVFRTNWKNVYCMVLFSC